MPLLLCGCATVNFSANYYTPPPNYKAEVINSWNELIIKLPLKYNYSMNIVSDRQCKMPGIPEIAGNNVKIPDNFIKYLYQNYYNDRFTVLACVIAHELCHSEYALYNQSTPGAHFQVDQKAVELLENGHLYAPQDLYRSLFVLKNYWFARKGAGGHLFNVGWNLVNAASVVYGGPGHFADWFATDLSVRMKMCRRYYNIRDGSCFSGSHKPENRQ